MIFLFLIRLFSVLLVNRSLGLSELPSFLLLLLLKSLVASCILKHPLRVFVAPSFNLLVILLGLEPELLIKLIFDFLLASIDLLNLAPNHQ